MALTPDEQLELLSLSNDDFADGLARLVKLFTNAREKKDEMTLFSPPSFSPPSTKSSLLRDKSSSCSSGVSIYISLSSNRNCHIFMISTINLKALISIFLMPSSRSIISYIPKDSSCCQIYDCIRHHF